MSIANDDGKFLKKGENRRIFRKNSKFNIYIDISWKLVDSKLIHGANTWQSNDSWNWTNETMVDIENIVYIENTNKSKVLQFEIGELLNFFM